MSSKSPSLPPTPSSILYFVSLPFSVGCWNILIACLRSLQNALLDGKRRHHFVPDLGGLGTLEVVREQKLLFFGYGLFGNLRQFSGMRDVRHEHDRKQ